MVEPFGAEGRVVRDEKEHRLLQPVHFISAGTRKPLPILMECLRVFDLARESRALARGSLFQLAGFSLARSLSLSSSSEANMSSALSNRARPLAFICATSSIAARVSALGTLSSSGKARSEEEHTSELQVTNAHLVCRLLLEKKNNQNKYTNI